MRPRAAKVLLGLAALGVMLALAAGYLFSHSLDVSPEPLAISRQFIDVVEGAIFVKLIF